MQLLESVTIRREGAIAFPQSGPPKEPSTSGHYNWFRNVFHIASAQTPL